MKIFKNRGDIYISKSGYKNSKEEQILLSLLAVILIFTIVFLGLLSHRYSSASQFFGEGEVETTQNTDTDEIALPEISGKTNFLIFETDEMNETIHYIYLLEADKDALAYKVCSLSPDTKIGTQSIREIFSFGGGASLQTKMTEYFGFEIDYYAQFTTNNFVEFINDFGSFIYPSNEEIKFSGGSGDDTYTIHIKEGEQTIDGKELSNLLRYYSLDKPNFERSNEIILYALTNLFNPENYEDAQALFRLFISSTSTNVTVRDFENGKDGIQVFCCKNTDITVYSCVAQYEKNIISQPSVQDIKGYFSK